MMIINFGNLFVSVDEPVHGSPQVIYQFGIFFLIWLTKVMYTLGTQEGLPAEFTLPETRLFNFQILGCYRTALELCKLLLR